MLASDRVRELGLGPAFDAVLGGEIGPARTALANLIGDANRRLGIATASSESDWFDIVCDLLLQSRCQATELHAELLLICARYYQTKGKIPLGIVAAQHGIKIAEEHGHERVLRPLWSILGNLHGATRDRAQETIAYARAIELAERLGDQKGMCATIANLAVARYNAGLLDESIALNRKAIILAGEDPAMVTYAAQAHHNIAVAALVLSDIDLARSSIARALELTTEPTTAHDARNRAIVEVTCTKILLKTGERDDAQLHARAAKHYAELSGTKPALVQAEIAQAWVDQDIGNTDVALTRLARLSGEANQYDPVQRDLLEVKVITLTKAQRHQEAEATHRRYLEHLSRWQRQASMHQIAVLKRAFLNPSEVSNDDLSLLDEALRRRIRDGEVDIATSFREKLEMLAVLAELRDDATGEHAYRVGKLAAIVGRRAGMDDQTVEDIEIAARLHDLGKLAVPDVVLQKRARLSPAELDVMRQHALEGYQILSAIGHPLFGLAGTIAWAHHEWWDGSGYPRGLRRSDIPESARITALADVYDALTHERPYKRAWPVKIAIEEIVSLSGSQFDPELCAHFLQVINELLAEHGGHLDAFLAEGARDSKLVSATRLIERAALLGRFPAAPFQMRR